MMGEVFIACYISGTVLGSKNRLLPLHEVIVKLDQWYT